MAAEFKTANVLWCQFLLSSNDIIYPTYVENIPQHMYYIPALVSRDMSLPSPQYATVRHTFESHRD